MGRRMNPPMGMSPPIYNMNNMLPLQYVSAVNATTQPKHRSTALSMTILGPIHASNVFHAIHHEEKYMSTINRES
jgi:hypothetical protein